MSLNDVERLLNRGLRENVDWDRTLAASEDSQLAMLRCLARTVGGEEIVTTFVTQMKSKDPDAIQGDEAYSNGALTVFVFTPTRLIVGEDLKPLEPHNFYTVRSVRRSSLMSFAVSGSAKSFNVPRGYSIPEMYRVTVDYPSLNKPYEIGQTNWDKDRQNGYDVETYQSKMDAIVSLLIEDQSATIAR